MRMAESNKLKTGIFSGSFNPVHIGHLALANYLCEYEELDEVWFMVSPQNPLNVLWILETRGILLCGREGGCGFAREFKEAVEGEDG